MIAAGFLLTAVAFVFVCGANDGGALVALAMRHRAMSASVVLTMLAAAIVIEPAWFGLAVARTFTERLTGGGGQAQLIVLSGAVVALVLVLVLTWRGIPTSITLAVLGGLAGAGTGLGAPPVWSALGRVLLIGALAPFVGTAVGFGLGRLARRLPATAAMSRLIRITHVAAFGGQCMAYAVNDGQKMFAITGVALAVVHGTTTAAPEAPLGLTLAIAAVFATGAAVSLRRVFRGATAGLLTVRGWQVVSAEFASSVAVLGTAGLGVPVSMTQSMTGGLVGAGASQGMRRVRWQYTMPIMSAWLISLPVSFLAGLVAGLILREVT